MVAIGDCMRRSHMRSVPSCEASRNVDSLCGGKSDADFSSSFVGGAVSGSSECGSLFVSGLAGLDPSFGD